MARLVPLASAWVRPNPIIRIGMIRTPPPIPTMPLTVPIKSPVRISTVAVVRDLLSSNCQESRMRTPATDVPGR